MRMATDKKQTDKQAMLVTNHVAEAGRMVFQQQLRQMILHEPGSRSGADIESVHKMRVAVRRMRSLLRLVGDYYKRKAIADTERALRDIARALGEIRDLDVLIVDLQQFSATLPPDAQQHAEALIKRLDRRRAKRRRRLNAFFDSKPYRRSLRQLERFGMKAEKADRQLKRAHDPHELRHVLPV